MQQHARDGGIHAAAQAQDHLVVPELRPEGLHGGLDEGIRRPVALQAADAVGEVRQDLGTFLRVEHFRMELDRKGRLAHDLVGGIRDVFRLGDSHAPFREAGNGVAVGHPHLGMDLHAVHQRRIRTDDVQHRPAVFPGEGTFDLAAAAVRDILGAIADAQQRQTAFHEAQIQLRSVGVPHGARTAGQDDSFHGVVQGRHLVEGKYFAENVQFAQTATDQLGHLGTEIEDQYLIHRGSSWAFPW